MFQHIQMLLELCQSDLEEQLADPEKKMTIPAILDLASQMAEVSKYMAVKKVIHRDIKPPNILINWPKSDCPTYKLADFGLVKNLGASELSMNAHQTMTWAGTTNYMAPEVFYGNIY